MDSSRLSELSRVSFEPTASDVEERSIGKDNCRVSFENVCFSFWRNKIA